jgi:nucleoside-diphosphate-sugar epimerase
MKQKVFITGGAGFIGSLLAVKFIRNGWDVVGYDALRSFVQPHERIDYPARVQYRLQRIQQAMAEGGGHGQFKLIEGDICNRALLERSMHATSPDVVIHLAAISIADASKRYFEEAIAINQTGTTNVLTAAAQCEVKRFVYASSSMAYGDFVHFPATEEHPTIPLEVYGAAKLCGEVYVRTYHEMFGLDFVILRPCSVYGPTDTNQRIVQRFVECGMQGREIQLFDGGTQLLDFTWVEDAAEGFYLAATHPAAVNETFNITSGTARTLRELADIARLHFPSLKVVARETSDPVRRTRRGALDVAKARRMLGYEPRTMLDAGFARYVDFCLEPQTCRPLARAAF